MPTFTGTSGNNTITASAGDDEIYALGGDDLVFAGAGNDVAYGAAGADVINGEDGNDELYGSTGNDVLNGNAGDDELYGQGGDDSLDGGTDADIMVGGTGNDHYYVDNVLDVVSEGAGASNGTADKVFASINYVLNANFENLELTGSGHLSATGNTVVNTLTGNAGDNVLDGRGGLDTLIGGNGNDTYLLGFGNELDTVTETGTVNSDADQIKSSLNVSALAAGVENLVLLNGATVGVGNSLNNILTADSLNTATVNLSGEAGNDTLYGFNGGDALQGGSGSDTYVINNAGVQISELTDPNDEDSDDAGGLLDTVQSSVSYALDEYVENLILTGTASQGTGNELNNTITLLNNTAGAVTLNGLEGNDALTGGTGNDLLDGGTGVDVLTGGLGADTYFVDELTDAVVETASGGIDTVESTQSYTLGEFVENLILAEGAGDLNGTGNSSVNTLQGNSGNNILTAVTNSSGVDTLSGLGGNDTYILSSVNDVIDELTLGANPTDAGGIDTVQVAGNYTLSDLKLENLTLLGTDGFSGYGNSGNNVLTGNSGNNILDGAAGNDTLIGGAGDDSYFVDAAGDVVTEGVNAGTDTVSASLSYTLDANLENLILTGTGTFSGTGNGADNSLTGNIGNNVLTGGLGSDTINGGGGVDRAVFTSGTLDFVGGKWTVTDGANVDTLTNVEVVQIGSQVYRLVDNANDGGYDSLQDAATAAAEGDIVQLAKGTFSGDTTVTGKGITIQGFGQNETTFNGQITADGTLNGAFKVEDLAINASLKSYGIYVLANSTGAGSVTVNDVSVANAASNSFWYSHPSNTSTTLATDTVGSITLTGFTSTNLNNPANSSANGLSDINIYGFNGELSLTDINISGSVANTSRAIQIRGLGHISNEPYTPLESLTLEGITVNGSYIRDMIAVYNYSEIYNQSYANLNLGTSAAWGLVNFDKVGGTITLRDLTGLNDVISSVTDGVPLVASLQGLSGVDTFTGTDGIDVLKGRGGADILAGAVGDDFIDGGSGVDTMIGGLGNDTYWVDETTDVVTEEAGEGMADLVQSSANYILAASVENLTLIGSAGITGTGNTEVNILTGNSGNNVLTSVANIPTGTFDTLIGGLGDDTYIIRNGDTLTELANGGSDTVAIGADYSLSSVANVENLTLLEGGQYTGTGNAEANVLTGNSQDNALFGGAGNDSLAGGLGDDSLFGEAGADLFDGGDGSDELFGGSGTDTLNGGAGDDSLFGSTETDTLNGGAGSDLINGQGGDDLITGGTGDDQLLGGTGNDTFFIAKGDGLDTIAEQGQSGSTDILNITGTTVSELVFGQDGSDLLIGYTNSSSVITVTSQLVANRLETIQVGAAPTVDTSITSDDVIELIQDMTAYINDNNLTIDLSNLTAVSGNEGLMNLISDAFVD